MFSGCGEKSRGVERGCAHGGYDDARRGDTWELPSDFCPGDANGSATVAFSDITSVLENWGIMYPGSSGPGDANHDSAVNFADITKVLENWGVACP